MTISKATILKNVWETFYDRVVSQVTSVTTGASDTFTIQTYTSSFPDKEIDTKSSYPIIVLNPIEIDWEVFTLKKKLAVGTATIDIYCTNSEATDMFLDSIINAIETYRDTLSELGLSFVNLESTPSDNVMRSGFKVHLRSATFSFKYSFTKTFP